MHDALLQRGAELAAVTRALEGARRRRGGVLVFDGPAGSGKTTMLRFAVEQARRAAFVTLTGRGAELERGCPFGAARQLLEPLMRDASPTERAGALAGSGALAAPLLGLPAPAHVLAPPDPVEAAKLGLTWLTRNLAASRPVLLAVDDVHLADEASLDWLARLEGQLDGLRALLIVAASGAGAPPFAGSSSVAILRLSPLEAPAAAALLRRVIGLEPDPAFTCACLAAGAGNPLLLDLLAREARRRGLAPLAANAGEVASLTSPDIDQLVRRRLGGLSRAAGLVARALAVFEQPTPSSDAALIAAVDSPQVTSAADELRAAGLLAPIDEALLLHPVVRRALQAQLPPHERSELHRRAAVALDRRGAPPGRVAAHLLQTDPTGARWVTARLRDAAQSSGARADAIALLRRALAEGIAEQRGDLLSELGAAETALRDPAAIDHLREAVAVTEGPVAREARAAALARALHSAGRLNEAAALLDQAAAGPPVSARVTAELCAATRLDPLLGRIASRRLAEVASRADAATRPALSAGVALDDIARGKRGDRAAALALAALAGGRLLAEETCESGAVFAACVALLAADRLAEARTALSAILADARERGSAVAVAEALAWRADARLREGDLAGALADGDAALRAGRPLGRWPATARAAATRALALVAEGRMADAAAALPRGEPRDDEAAAWARVARGTVALAAERHNEAVEELRAAGRVLHNAGAPAPALVAWRPALVTALAALGLRGEALATADEAVELARRTRTPRPLGLALTARAALVPADAQPAAAEEAVEALRGSPCRLELAAAILAHGAALRRAGRPTQARAPLRESLGLAAACGAGALAARARQELVAAGARPRRSAASGVDALTPAELRAARLAADGLTNRAIAGRLCVTVKTVETELSHAYAKLGIRTRRELTSALGAGDERSGSRP